MHVAYLLSSFPTLPETFIREEVFRLLEDHIQVTVFSLKKPGILKTDDPQISKLIAHTFYSPFFWSIALWQEHFRFLFRSPGRYGRLLGMIFEHLARQPVELLKTLAVFPKLVYFSALARQAGCERVHAHFANVPAMGAMIVARILDLPFSITAHGSDIYEYPPIDFKERIQAASPFITISNHNCEYLARTYSLPVDQIQVVHCGIDLSKFPYRSRRVQSGQKMHILTVARLEPVKGIDLLLNAARILADRRIDFQWLVIGDGPGKPEYLKLHADLKLGLSLKFLGALPHGRVIEQYACADLFVLTSRREGIPVSAMEAMAMGLPVIVPDVSGLPELVEQDQNGILVQAGDPRAFADAIAMLGSDPQKFERISKNARWKIEQQFDIQKTVLQLVHLWQAANP